MPTKKTATKSKAVKSVKKVDNSFANGLSEAVMGFTPGGIGTQLNQVDTIFINQRWYLISNMRQVLSQSYVENGLIQGIVDIPVDDGMGGQIEIKSKQLSSENIEELKAWLHRDLVLQNVVGQAVKWDRLFGGSGIVVLTDQDPTTPLNLDALTNEKLDFRAVDMWELFWSQQNTENYNLTTESYSLEYYDYYGIKVHKSRVMTMKGIVAPSFIRPRLRGWGVSVVETLVSAINQYLKSNNLAFEILDEFKLDVFLFKNLTETLFSAEGDAKVRKRIQLANQQKSYQNAIVLDSQDQFEQKQVSFTGIPEMYKEFRMQIASAMRMPMSKIFGIPSAGFSSGEDDIENYNKMVESSVRNKVRQHISKILELKSQQLFGFCPEDIVIDFEPLRYLSLEQEENVKTQKFNRLLATQQAGLMTVKEFKDACNKDDLLGIQVNANLEKIETGEDVGEEASAPAAKDKAPSSKIDAPTAKNSNEENTNE